LKRKDTEFPTQAFGNDEFIFTHTDSTVFCANKFAPTIRVRPFEYSLFLSR